MKKIYPETNTEKIFPVELAFIMVAIAHFF